MASPTLIIENRAPYNCSCKLTFMSGGVSQVRTVSSFGDGQNRSIIVPSDATKLQLNVHASGGTDATPLFLPDASTWSNSTYKVKTHGTVLRPSVKADN